MDHNCMRMHFTALHDTILQIMFLALWIANAAGFYFGLLGMLPNRMVPWYHLYVLITSQTCDLEE